MQNFWDDFNITFFLIGCASPGVQRTTSLSPGMTFAEVKASMGKDPSQTQFVGDKLIWKYQLQEAWKGAVPYYLVFNKDTHLLESWYENEDEYNKQQQLWLQAIPSTQTENVNINATVHQK